MNVTLDNAVWGRFRSIAPEKNDVEKLGILLDMYERWVAEHKEEEIKDA